MVRVMILVSVRVRVVCKIPLLARRATIGYLVYKGKGQSRGSG